MSSSLLVGGNGFGTVLRFRVLSTIRVECGTVLESSQGHFGTRSSTVVLVQKDGVVHVVEKARNKGPWNTREFTFVLPVEGVRCKMSSY